MKTIVIKIGPSGSLSLADEGMPPGWLNPSKKGVAYLHIEGVPNHVGAPEVIVKLKACVPMVFTESKIADEDDFRLAWESLKPGAIIRTRKRRADLHDWIQDSVIARANKLGLTSYAIAKASEGAVSEDHVRDYLTRAKSMGSHKLQHVLRVLGLKISE